MDTTHSQLLKVLFELGGDIEALIRRFSLSPDAFLAFAQDPDVNQTLACLDALKLRHARMRTFDHHRCAAENLRKTLDAELTTIERRRAATALTRVAAAMLNALKPPRPNPQPRANTHAAPAAEPESAPATPIPANPAPPSPIPTPKPPSIPATLSAAAGAPAPLPTPRPSPPLPDIPARTRLRTPA